MPVLLVLCVLIFRSAARLVVIASAVGCVQSLVSAVTWPTILYNQWYVKLSLVTLYFCVLDVVHSRRARSGRCPSWSASHAELFNNRASRLVVPASSERLRAADLFRWTHGQRLRTGRKILTSQVTAARQQSGYRQRHATRPWSLLVWSQRTRRFAYSASKCVW